MAPVPAAAQSRIKVIVNDQPITSYEIAQRARLLRLTRTPGNVTKLATNELIEDKLKLYEAKRRGVVVSSQETDRAYAGIAQRTKMSPSQLSKALSRSGVNPKTLKERIRAQIAWQRIVRARFNATVKVNEQAIQAALTKDGSDKQRMSTEYTFQRILFVIPGGSSKAKIAQRRREANNLRARFKSCDSGIELAKTLREVIIKSGGTRTLTEFPEGYRKLIEKTPVGQLTPPQQSGNAMEMLAICGKKDVESDAEARAEIQDKMLVQEGELMARRYIRDLRRDAIIQYR